MLSVTRNRVVHRVRVNGARFFPPLVDRIVEHSRRANRIAKLTDGAEFLEPAQSPIYVVTLGNGVSSVIIANVQPRGTYLA